MDNVTPIGTSESWPWPVDEHGCPKGYVYHKDFPELCVAFEGGGSSEGPVWIEYRGSADDLIGAAVATPEMLTSGVKGRRRAERIYGLKYVVRKWWVNVPAAPKRRYGLRLKGLADQLPGASDAVAAYMAREIWFGRIRLDTLERMQRGEPGAPKPPCRRPLPDYLRVVK